MNDPVAKIHFTNEVTDVEVEAGTTLLAACQRAGVVVFRGLWPWLHCQGAFPGKLLPSGSCGRCTVWIRGEAAAANAPTGRERLHPKLATTFRLACQVRVLGDLQVTTRPGWENPRR